MQTIFYRPQNDEVRHVVDSIWIREGEVDIWTEKDLPCPFPELGFNLGDVYDVDIGHDSRVTADSRSWLSGIYTRPRSLTARGDTLAVGVSFYPWGIKRMFDLQPENHVNGTVSAEPYSSVELRGLVTTAGLRSLGNYGRREFLHDLEMTIRSALKPRENDPWLPQLMTELEEEPPDRRPIHVLAEHRDISLKTMIQRFRRGVGLTPYRYARLIQIHGAIWRMHEQPDSALTEIAYQSGFFDQAHFTRTFSQFCGMTPSAYRQVLRHRNSADGVSWITSVGTAHDPIASDRTGTS